MSLCAVPNCPDDATHRNEFYGKDYAGKVIFLCDNHDREFFLYGEKYFIEKYLRKMNNDISWPSNGRHR